LAPSVGWRCSDGRSGPFAGAGQAAAQAPCPVADNEPASGRAPSAVARSECRQWSLTTNRPARRPPRHDEPLRSRRGACLSGGTPSGLRQHRVADLAGHYGVRGAVHGRAIRTASRSRQRTKAPPCAFRRRRQRSGPRAAPIILTGAQGQMSRAYASAAASRSRSLLFWKSVPVQRSHLHSAANQQYSARGAARLRLMSTPTCVWRQCLSRESGVRGEFCSRRSP
jgi:hypothetical protein